MLGSLAKPGPGGNPHEEAFDARCRDRRGRVLGSGDGRGTRTRQLRGTPDTVLVAWQTAAALGLGAVLAPFSWSPPSLRDYALLGLLGIVAMLAHVATNRSLKLAPASTVVPYQYTLIVWAVVLGWIFFNDVPAWTTVIGAGVIIAAGIWIFLDEKREGQEELIAAETRGE